MSRVTQNLVLLLVGLSTAVMLAKGTYLNYVKPALLPWLAVAAAVLVALARGDRARPAIGSKRPRGRARPSAPAVARLAVADPHRDVAFVVPPPLDASGAKSAPSAHRNDVPFRRCPRVTHRRSRCQRW